MEYPARFVPWDPVWQQVECSLSYENVALTSTYFYRMPPADVPRACGPRNEVKEQMTVSTGDSRYEKPAYSQWSDALARVEMERRPAERQARDYFPSTENAIRALPRMAPKKPYPEWT